MELKQSIIKTKQWIASKLSVGTDKIDHFAVGFTLGLFGFYELWLGIALGGAFGIGKEIYDYFHRDVHTPDINDAIATILGTALAIIIISIEVNRGL